MQHSPTPSRMTIWSAALAVLLLPLASLSIAQAGINLSPPNICLLTFLVFCMVGIVRGRYSILVAYPTAITLGFALLGWIVLTSVMVHVSSVNFWGSSAFVGAFLFFPLGAYIAFCSRSSSFWGLPLLIGAVSAALVGILHYMDILPLFEFERYGMGAREFAGYYFRGGYTGLIGGRGDYGIWLLGAGMFAVRLIVLSPLRIARLGAWASLPILGYAIVVSLSRSTWMATFFAVAAATVLLWVQRGRSRRERIVRRDLSVFLCALGTGVLLYLGILQYLFEELVDMDFTTHENRLIGFYSAVLAFLDSPVFGQGAAGYLLYNPTERFFHNTFLNLLASHGAPAFLLFTLLLGHTFFRTIGFARISPARAHRVILGLWIAWFMGALIELSLYPGETSKHFWALFGFMCGEGYRISLGLVPHIRGYSRMSLWSATRGKAPTKAYRPPQPARMRKLQGGTDSLGDSLGSMHRGAVCEGMV